MIENFAKAWDKNNKLLLDEFKKNMPSGYDDIVKKLVNIVINPFLKDIYEDLLDIDNMTIIDNGHYQGTQIFIIPFDTYQPELKDYVITHNEYGSCSGCDTYLRIAYRCEYDENEKEIVSDEMAKDFNTLALHILKKFKYFDEKNELKEENNILKLKLADLEVKNFKLQEELKTVMELYERLAENANK